MIKRSRGSRAARAGIAGRLGLASLVLVGLAGCSQMEASYPEKVKKGEGAVYRKPGEELQRDSIWGDDSPLSFGGRKKTDAAGGAAGLGVNSWLWRAALDTIAFMPLSSADPFGGVIITDWYQPSESPSERFKVNVFFMSNELRADGVKVSVFRQIRNHTGDWAEAPVDAATEMENAILTRARQLRMASAQAK